MNLIKLFIQILELADSLLQSYPDFQQDLYILQ